MWTAAALSAAGVLSVRAAFQQDLAAARRLTENRSALAATRYGALEYADTQAGAPLVMVHGTGGGFDQGLLFAEPLRQRGWRIIAPSRFGYLRSDFPSDATPEMQADAFVDLLDGLSIERVPVNGGSAGAPSALAFAIRYPDRCSALVALVPAAYAPGRPPVKPPNAVAKAIIEYALQSDFLFWLGLEINRDAMIASLLATDPKRVHAASASEQARVRAILRGILPVSRKTRGLLSDARQSFDPAPMDLSKIASPTLALSLADDQFQTLAAARHIAESVDRAQLITFDHGGHVWAGHNDEVGIAIDLFLRQVQDAETKPSRQEEL